MYLNSKSYAKAVETAAYIRAAEKPIRILRSLSWDPEIGASFVKSGATQLPSVEYPVFDGAQSREFIAKARAIGQGEHPVFEWLMRVADKLEIAAAMLENTGNPAFYAHSARLYGTPDAFLLDKKTKTINLARHMDATLANLDFDKLVLGGEDVELSAQEFGALLEVKLSKHFHGNAPEIILTDHLSAKVLAGSKSIKVNKNASFAPMDVHQLLQHEALVHTASALNGKSQPDFEILGAAHP